MSETSLQNAYDRIEELELGDHVVHQRGTSTIEGTVYSFSLNDPPLSSGQILVIHLRFK